MFCVHQQNLRKWKWYILIRHFYKDKHFCHSRMSGGILNLTLRWQACWVSWNWVWARLFGTLERKPWERRAPWRKMSLVDLLDFFSEATLLYVCYILTKKKHLDESFETRIHPNVHKMWSVLHVFQESWIPLMSSSIGFMFLTWQRRRVLKNGLHIL